MKGSGVTGDDKGSQSSYGCSMMELHAKTLNAFIFDAIKRGDAKLIGSLLADKHYTPFGAYKPHTILQVEDKFGSTCLHEAAKEGDSLIVSALLLSKADVHRKDRWGLTPAMRACYHGQAKVAETLFAWKACPNTAAQNGDTALHYAACHGYHDVLRILIQVRAAVDISSYNGDTALAMAVQKAHDETIDILLEARADPNTGGGNMASRGVVIAPNSSEMVQHPASAPKSPLKSNNTGNALKPLICECIGIRGEDDQSKKVDKIMASFKKWDSGGKGKLSYEQLSKVLMFLDKSMSHQMCRAVFTDIDRGKSGDISYEEFVDWVLPMNCSNSTSTSSRCSKSIPIFLD